MAKVRPNRYGGAPKCSMFYGPRLTSKILRRLRRVFKKRARRQAKRLCLD